MIAQEAIKIIKHNYPKTTKMVDGRYQGGFDDHECEFGVSLDMAISALEKQIPKKPLKSDRQEVRYSLTYDCPTCGKKFTGTGIADYCYHCGQALDWGDE